MVQQAMAWVGLAAVLMLAADMLLLTLQHKGWPVRRPWAHWGGDGAERQREKRRVAAQRLHRARQSRPRSEGACEPQTARTMVLAPLTGRHNRT